MSSNKGGRQKQDKAESRKSATKSNMGGVPSQPQKQDKADSRKSATNSNMGGVLSQPRPEDPQLSQTNPQRSDQRLMQQHQQHSRPGNWQQQQYQQQQYQQQQYQQQHQQHSRPGNWQQQQYQQQQYQQQLQLKAQQLHMLQNLFPQSSPSNGWSTRADAVSQKLDLLMEALMIAREEFAQILTSAREETAELLGSNSKLHIECADKKKQLDEKTEEIEMLRKEIDDVRMRLSKMTSERMKEGNPCVEDLSIPHRPTAVKDKWDAFFNTGQYWTTYIDLKRKDIADDEIMRILHRVCQVVYTTCATYVRRLVQEETKDLTQSQPTSRQPEDSFSDENKGETNKSRRKETMLSMSQHKNCPEDLKQQCVRHVQNANPDIEEKQLKTFVYDLADMCYHIRTQEIPLVVDFTYGPGSPADKSLFVSEDGGKPLASGAVIQCVLRPPLLRQSGGAVLSKGVVSLVSEESRVEKSNTTCTQDGSNAENSGEQDPPRSPGQKNPNSESQKDPRNKNVEQDLMSQSTTTDNTDKNTEYSHEYVAGREHPVHDYLTQSEGEDSSMDGTTRRSPYIAGANKQEPLQDLNQTPAENCSGPVQENSQTRSKTQENAEILGKTHVSRKDGENDASNASRKVDNTHEGRTELEGTPSVSNISQSSPDKNETPTPLLDSATQQRVPTSQENTAAQEAVKSAPKPPVGSNPANDRGCRVRKKYRKTPDMK